MNREDDVELLSRETAWQGRFRLRRYSLVHSKYDGGRTAPITREVFERGHSAGLLPYDPVRDEIVLIEQFRAGAYAAGLDNPWLIEIVAGIIGEGETGEDVARRECLEETGIEAGAIERICAVLPSPGGCSERCDLFCARVDASAAAGVHGLDTESEDIRVFTATPDAAATMIADGYIVNGIAVTALYWLFLNRDWLRRHWAE